MRPVLTLLFLAILGVPPAAVGQEIEASGWEISGRIHDAARTEFVARIHDAPLTAELAAGVNRWWSTLNERKPSRVVTDLALWMGGKELPIPRRAYSDLGEPSLQSLALTFEGKDIRLALRGGDAGGSYTATFVFRRGKLIRREVEPGELFFKSLRQVTTYR